MPALELRLFGGLTVRSASGEAVQLAGQKDQALLGFLALSPGTAYARDRLASLLWSDRGEKQARDSLKQCLLRLRRSLEPIAPSALVADRRSASLDASMVSVDVGRLEQWLKDGTAQSIERAVALYSGELLEGLGARNAGFEDWLLVERQRLRQLVMESLASLMAMPLAAGWRDRAVAAARRLLSLDPVHEAACRVLMRSLADRQERAQALKLFEGLRSRLQQELGVEPDPETIALYQSIRSRRAPLALPPDPAIADAGRSDGDESASAANVARPAPADRPAVAVLPFGNIGGDPEQACLADGLTEDLITDLSQVSGLFVVARHTAFKFKDRAIPIHEVAQQLGVGFVLEGTVRKAGSSVRVTAQLIDGGTGGHVWAGRYDRSLDDIFALQAEISRSIVDVLRVKLLPEEIETMASRSTSSVEAYEYYQIGRSFYLRGIDKRSLSIARAMYARASEIDPCYARAYAGLATCESYLMMSDPVTSLESILAKVARALELEPNLAEAYAVKGMVLYSDGRYVEAALQLERAMALDPDLFEAHFFHGRNCRLQGRREQAAASFERSAELRPNDFRSVGLLAEEYRWLGRRDDFQSAARRCLERVTAEVTAHPENADAWAFGSSVLASLGEPARAEQWATRAIMIGPDDHLVHYNVARTFAVIDQTERALDWLERAFGAFPPFTRRLAAWMGRDDFIDPLRGLPRFQALAQRLMPANDPATMAPHAPAPDDRPLQSTKTP